MQGKSSFAPQTKKLRNAADRCRTQGYCPNPGSYDTIPRLSCQSTMHGSTLAKLWLQYPASPSLFSALHTTARLPATIVPRTTIIYHALPPSSSTASNNELCLPLALSSANHDFPASKFHTVNSSHYFDNKYAKGSNEIENDSTPWSFTPYRFLFEPD